MNLKAQQQKLSKIKHRKKKINRASSSLENFKWYNIQVIMTTKKEKKMKENENKTEEIMAKTSYI